MNVSIGIGSNVDWEAKEEKKFWSLNFNMKTARRCCKSILSLFPDVVNKTPSDQTAKMDRYLQVLTYRNYFLVHVVSDYKKR